MNEQEVIVAMLKRLQAAGGIHDLTMETRDGKTVFQHGLGPYTVFVFDQQGVCVKHDAGF